MIECWSARTRRERGYARTVRVSYNDCLKRAARFFQFKTDPPVVNEVRALCAKCALAYEKAGLWTELSEQETTVLLVHRS